MKRFISSRPRLTRMPLRLCALAAISVCTLCVQAYQPPPIPERSGTYSWSQRQRIRYLNTPLMNRAQKALAEGAYAEADTLFNQILSNDPQNNHVKVFLVEVYDSTGKYEQGLALAKQILTDYPDYLDLYAYQGYMHLKRGETEAARLAFELLLSRAEKGYALRTDILKNLGEIYLIEGEAEKAYDVALELLQTEDTFASRRFAAETAIPLKKWDEAATHLNRAAALAETPWARARLQMAHASALFNVGRDSDILPLLDQAESHLIEPAEQQKLLRLRGQTLFRLHRFSDAAEAFSEALTFGFDEAIASSLFDTLRRNEQMTAGEQAAQDFLLQLKDVESDRTWQLYMARLDYRQKQYQAVINRLLPISPSHAILSMYIGFSFYHLSMPGLSLLYLNRVDDPETLPREQQQTFYTYRAYLNVGQNQNQAALEDIDRSLSFQDTERLHMLRIQTLIRMQKYEEAVKEARQQLGDVPNQALHEEILALLEQHPDPAFRETILSELQSLSNARYQAELSELMGLGLLRSGDPAEAIEAFTRALKLQPNRASSHYLRGISFFQLEKFKEAEMDALLFYDQAETLPSSFWRDLGILAGELNDFDLGTAALERSLAVFPYDIDSYAETGYQHMKHRKNIPSKKAFAAAISLYSEVLPYLTSEELDEYTEANRAMKREYTTLDRVWGLQADMRRTDFGYNDADLVRNVDATEGALLSQAGLDIRYRPPKLGFRNQKELDLFARVLGNLEPDSWCLDSNTLQGGAGVRYNPLSRHDLVLSLERLFKIGDHSENNWLWRNTYEWERGEKPQKYESVWLYNRVVGEISYYLEDEKRWVYYLNPKGGYSTTVFSDRILLTAPEATGIVRYQSNDPSGLGSYAYGGVGANVRMLSREKEFSIDRWYFDLYAHYVWGRFDQTPDGFNHPDFEGLILGASFMK